MVNGSHFLSGKGFSFADSITIAQKLSTCIAGFLNLYNRFFDMNYEFRKNVFLTQLPGLTLLQMYGKMKPNSF